MHKIIVFDLVLIGKGVHLFLEGNFYNKYLLCFPPLSFNVCGESTAQTQNIRSEKESDFIQI